MKAIIHIIVVLITIHFGALEAFAQSARRGRIESKENNVTAERPDRSIRNTSTARESERMQRPTGVKSSTTNRHNPRSTYRAPHRETEVRKTYHNPKSSVTKNGTYEKRLESRKSNAYRTDRYYYPNTKVKIHRHPATHHNHYRVLYYPAHRDIIWTRRMYRDYAAIYPGYTWRYPIGYRIQTISALDARYNIGDVTRVYGRVFGTWYNRQTDDLLLFFGGEYPYQTFTMVIPGNIARKYSWRPEKYFLGQHVIATGLITSFEGKPEMLIKRNHQLDVY